MVDWRQYAIIIKDGDDKDEKQYRTTSIQRISLAMCKIYHYPLSGRKNPYSLKLKKFPKTTAKFEEGKDSSLEIISENIENAEGMEKYLSLVEG